MTEKEKLVNRHLFGTQKAVQARSDVAAQQEAKTGPKHLRNFLSNDPEVLELTREGMESFVLRTAQRILDDHASDVFTNRCPRCGEVTNTPKARQCRACRHDWHEPLTTRDGSPHRRAKEHIQNRRPRKRTDLKVAYYKSAPTKVSRRY